MKYVCGFCGNPTTPSEQSRDYYCRSCCESDPVMNNESVVESVKEARELITLMERNQRYFERVPERTEEELEGDKECSEEDLRELVEKWRERADPLPEGFKEEFGTGLKKGQLLCARELEREIEEQFY